MGKRFPQALYSVVWTLLTYMSLGVKSQMSSLSVPHHFHGTVHICLLPRDDGQCVMDVILMNSWTRIKIYRA